MICDMFSLYASLCLHHSGQILVGKSLLREIILCLSKLLSTSKHEEATLQNGLKVIKRALNLNIKNQGVALAIQEVVHTTEILSPFLKAALLHILDYEETFYIAMHDALEEKGIQKSSESS